MSTKADELKLDIEEINNLLQHASRQRSKDVLGLEIRRLQTELMKSDEGNKVTSTSTNAVSNASDKCYEVKLNNYGWDQSSTRMTLYITLKDVHQLPKEAVICNFTEKSIDLRVLRLDNKNYRLTINDLCEEIDAEQSNVRVKTDMVIVNLFKRVAKNWSHVTAVEKRIKELKKNMVPNVGEDTDLGAGLMNVVKKMYQEGDDEMKKTIAKAWTKLH
ncbi:calcyclin-binding protein [Andrena cerasifolii]|uniref:calcyclin-binding protein n=1 Tax=Andrena cerasifolii TaxID=2819439 RepID=UPI0040377192